ncbi:MAG: TonB-dependent receptor family protein [Leptothrix sp. (in: b-proteobacteria)]
MPARLLRPHPRAAALIEPSRTAASPLSALALACTALLAALPALAQEAPDAAALEPVVITGGTREQRVIDAPYAISSIGAQQLRSAGPMVNLSEALASVPGLTVANRNNYAQDLQISSRGFGARAGFGVRGMRLYADGIPATMPDGQGQVAHFDLASAERIEVLRGPFSALYGNSSGGVIALFTAPATETAADVGVDFGSFGLRQQRIAVGSPVGDNVDLGANVSHFRIDGFRPHSAAERNLANVRIGYHTDSDRVVLSASTQDQQADDPLGLTRVLFNANPRGTTPEAEQFQTRKTIAQTQVGLAWSHQLGLGPLDAFKVSTYSGTRSVSQYLAIPFGTQNGNRHGGGLIDFDRRYSGLDTRLLWKLDPVDLVTGVNIEQQTDQRRGYLSFTHAPVAPATTPAPDYGNQGALKRDETNHATTREAYTQAEWKVTEATRAVFGVRAGEVALSTDDHFIKPAVTNSNLDDSGALKFHYSSPVVGLRHSVDPTLTLHASASRGFESPTLGELAYQANANNAGFNSALRPQTSRQIEVGAKWRPGSGLPEFDAAVFDIRTTDEIAVLTNSGGRSAFQNVGHTSRKGYELASRWRVTPSVRAQLAYTRLDATYLDSFTTCRNTPCQVATAQAGNRIAGTQPTSVYAELAWKPDPAGEVALEVRNQGRTPVNDLNDDYAAGFTVANLRYTRRIPLGPSDRIELLTRADNVTGRRYAGSVIVNEGNNRFFEPGAPRNYLGSVRWHHSW